MRSFSIAWRISEYYVRAIAPGGIFAPPHAAILLRQAGSSRRWGEIIRQAG
jgi:hypothetical protein